MRIKQTRSVAPDGGWGWVVAFASAFIYFLAFGITSIGGLLMLAYTKRIFQDSRSQAIWIPVLCNGMSRLFAPVAIYFSNKYSYRSVIFAGGILISLGFALSFSASSFNLLFGYFGIIVGIGVSFCVYPTSILTTLYFDKHASFANGIYTAGQAFGCIIFPICVDPLFSLVGIRDTFLYLAGIGLQICVAAALCQPVEWHMKTIKIKEIELDTENSVSNVNVINDNKLCHDSDETQSSFSSSFLTNRNFYFLSLGLTAVYLGMATYPIILPEYALEAVPGTLSLDKAAYLLSAGAAADFVTRSSLSWVFDLAFINRNYCFYGSCVLGGTAVFLTAFVPNYTFLLIICVCTGVSAGICSILAAVIYKENLGVNSFGLALTTASLISGVMAILVGSAANPLRALTGSYNIMFFIIGGYQLCGVFIWLASRFCCKE